VVLDEPTASLDAKAEHELFARIGELFAGTGFSDADLAALPSRLAPLASKQRPARVDARQEPDVWFEPGLVLEILSAELTLSPNYTAGWGQIKEDAGLAMRFPRFTGRWRDDKSAQDATTTEELIDLYRTARRTPLETERPLPSLSLPVRPRNCIDARRCRCRRLSRWCFRPLLLVARAMSHRAGGSGASGPGHGHWASRSSRMRPSTGLSGWPAHSPRDRSWRARIRW
jgi:hypothetical protein